MLNNKNYSSYLLKDLCSEITVGFVGAMTKEYVNVGVPLLRSLNIKPYSLNMDSLKYVSKEFHKKISKSALTEGDVVIVRTGQPGTSCVIPKGYKNLNCSDLVIIRPDINKINPYYLSFFFNSTAKKYVGNHKVGAIQQHFNVGSAKTMIINIPEINEQEKLVKILNDLNCKIVLNNKINTELESMAKLIYDYWFVQFDFPDANGKPYKSSGGKMVYNKDLKKKIPVGWLNITIADWIKNDKSGDWGKDIKQGNYVQQVSCIRGADINGINGTAEVKSPIRFILEKNNHKILEVGDLIIEISGGSPTQSTGRMTYIIQETLERFGEPIICSNFCKAITLLDKHSLYNFVYLWKRLYDAGVLFGWEGKTSGIKNLLFDSFINDFQTCQPETQIMKLFYNKVNAMNAKIQVNLKENQNLKKLRDWLLPMIMNGQITVKEAEERIRESMVAEPVRKYGETV